MKNQWAELFTRYDELGAPLKPTPEDLRLYQSQIKPGSRTLLLGVTTALMPISSVAVDHNPQVIEITGSNAVLGDWADLPFGPEFDAVIGDGSLNAFMGTPELFFSQVKKVLKKGGRLVLRVYISPEKRENLQWVLDSRGEMSFHAYKFRVFQAMATPYVRVDDLYHLLRPIHDHPTLDFYRDSDAVYYFPMLSELPPWDHIAFPTSYELSERCPIVTWEMNSSNLPGGNELT